MLLQEVAVQLRVFFVNKHETSDDSVSFPSRAKARDPCSPI